MTLDTRRRRRMGLSASTNLSLPNFKAAVAAVRAGSKNATILCLGDSTTAGYGANNNSWIGGRAVSYPAVLSAQLLAGGIPSLNASICGEQNIAATGTPLGVFSTYDPRVTYGTGWAADGAAGSLGSRFFAGGTLNGVLSLAPVEQIDTIEVWYGRANPGLGTFSVNVDGGASLGSVNTNGAFAFLKATFTCALGVHTINLVATVANIFITAIIAYNSASKVVNVVRAGWAAATISDIDTIANPWSSLTAGVSLTPDLVLISANINDWINNTNQATYLANLNAVIDAFQVSGTTDILLIKAPYSATTVQSQSIQNTFNGLYDSVSVSQGLQPPLSVPGVIGSTYVIANGGGFMFDDRHPNGAGYNKWANMVSAALRSAV